MKTAAFGARVFLCVALLGVCCKPGMFGTNAKTDTSAAGTSDTDGAKSSDTDGAKTSDADGAGKSDTNGAKAQETGLFDGRLVSTNATELNAPENTFRVGGWRSFGGWTKLVEIKPDGEGVQEGEVVASFEFSYERALTWIRERLQTAQAEAEKSAIELNTELEALQVQARQREIEAAHARVDTLKADAISKRQLEFYQIQYRIAQFEAEAIKKRIEALRADVEAEKDYHDKEVALRASDLDRYDGYKSRFELRAPHAGVVRHAYNKRERRKVQKGDGLPCGDSVLSIAKDEKLSVRFFVPEYRMGELDTGKEVTVLSPVSDEQYTAVISSIDRFPQELGFLLDDEQLPNAREKAHAVVADFAVNPPGLAAGNETKVRLQ